MKLAQPKSIAAHGGSCPTRTQHREVPGFRRGALPAPPSPETLLVAGRPRPIEWVLRASSKRVPSLLFLFALLLTPESPAQPPARDADDLLVPLLQLPSARRFAVGMTRAEVLRAAGAPDTKLDAHVWVYWDFHVQGISVDKTYDTLLVVFASDRVAFFKLCAQAPVLAFIARQPAVAHVRLPAPESRTTPGGR